MSVQDAQLQVRLGGLLVGHLSQRRVGRVWWKPEPEWLTDQRPRLGLHMLRSPGDLGASRIGYGDRESGYQYELPPFFENLLPEAGSVLRARLARIHGLNPRDGLGLLRALGSDLPGAVEVVGRDVPNDRGPTTPPAEISPEAERWRFSLAGMQLKLTMSMASERLAVTAQSVGRKWIVKLPGPTYAELPAVEHTTMRWARAMGLPVPMTMVVPAEQLDGLPPGWLEGVTEVFAIERFDRRTDGSRIHHEDFCQALNLLPHDKYGDRFGRRVTLGGVIRLVADAAGETEARAFCRRLGFVIASGNDDAHLKNWSFEWGNADLACLSPCYDLVSTIAWPAHGWEAAGGGPTLSLGGPFSQIDRLYLTRLAQRARRPWVTEVVLGGIQAARDAWLEVVDQAPTRMRTALATHWRAVPVLRDMGPLAP